MRMKKTILLLWLTAVSLSAVADDAPFRVAEGLFDAALKETMGLGRVAGAETVTVFAAAEGTDHYANGVVMTAYRGALYCMWQSSAKDEDADDTWVAYARSEDEGRTWSAPMVLCPTIANGYCASGGWLATEDLLIGYINVRPKSVANSGGFTQYVESTDGVTWTEPRDVTMADGSALDGIFEQDPHVLAGGRIVGAAHFQPGLKLCPIYTDDPTGRTGWRRGQFQHTDNGTQSVELEPSFFQQADGTLVMVMRDQKSSYHTLAATSSDRGETWTRAVRTTMPDSRAKQCAGNLPDGTAFLVNNPGRVTNTQNTTWRVPLALTLSADGHVFDRSYLLRSGESGDYPARRYEGKSKTLGYSYPKALVHGGYLYVSYATNKDDAQYTRVPLSAISTGIQWAEAAGDVTMSVQGRVLTVSTPSAGPVTVDVYTLSGQHRQHATATGGTARLALDPTCGAVCIVRIQTARGSVVRKVTIRP